MFAVKTTKMPRLWRWKKWAVIVLDSSSQVRFDKPMLTKAKVKTTVHAIMHALWPT